MASALREPEWIGLRARVDRLQEPKAVTARRQRIHVIETQARRTRIGLHQEPNRVPLLPGLARTAPVLTQPALTVRDLVNPGLGLMTARTLRGIPGLWIPTGEIRARGLRKDAILKGVLAPTAIPTQRTAIPAIETLIGERTIIRD